MPNRITRAAAKTKRKRRRPTFRAPLVRTNAVSGKGGGSKANTPVVSAPIVFTRVRRRSSLRFATNRDSPVSPIFAPIKYVTPAPRTEPAAVSNGYSQNSDGLRAQR